MRRKAFCVVADIEPRRFDTFLTRGQVPFSKSEEGWGQYTLNDAFLLRLMLDLIDRGGCEIGLAHQTLRLGLTTHWLAEYPLTRNLPKDDIWVATGEIAYGNSEEYTMSSAFFAGRFVNIPRFLRGIGENVAETTGLLSSTHIVETEKGLDLREVFEPNPDYHLGRIVMANATLAARKVIKAAEALDIEYGDEDFPAFPKDAPGAMSEAINAGEGWVKFLERTKETKEAVES